MARLPRPFLCRKLLGKRTMGQHMIIDFHTHALSPEHQAQFTTSKFHGRVLAASSHGRRPPHTIENVLEAQKIGGVEFRSSAIRCMTCATWTASSSSRPSGTTTGSSPPSRRNTIRSTALPPPFPTGTIVSTANSSARSKQDGLKGAWITSSLQGRYPDDDEALAFFQLAVELDVPVVVHPPAVGFGEERMRDYRLASSIGRPMDGALAIARCIVRGLFEKFPTLKLVGTHLGGGICEMIGRMDYAYKLQDEAFFLGSYEPMLIKHPPSHYLKMMYLESTCYWVPGARCALETVGADRFIFGTDAPPLTSLKAEGVALIKKLGLSAADERKVYFENAKKLLKI